MRPLGIDNRADIYLLLATVFHKSDFTKWAVNLDIIKIEELHLGFKDLDI